METILFNIEIYIFQTIVVFCWSNLHKNLAFTG